MSPTPPSALEVVREFVQLRADGDVVRAFALAHDDVEFILHLSEEAVPIGGVRRGKAGIVADLLAMSELIDHFVWRPKKMVAQDGGVRVAMEFLFRHRPSGQLIDGDCRILFTVADGLVTRIEEFHDRAKMEAFFKLFGPPPAAGGDGEAAGPAAGPVLETVTGDLPR